MHKTGLKKAFPISALALALCLGYGPFLSLSLAADYSASTAQSTILAPEGLSQKEKTQLERQYKFQYRNKKDLLSPYISSAGGPVEESELKALNEKERLYRYFGIATELQKAGRTEEALEILRYILTKQPDDAYIKNYLKQAVSESNVKKSAWEKTTARDAQILKDGQIKELISDGIEYYQRNDYDAALLKFADAISLDPNNSSAKKYLELLKKHYLKEIQVEDIVIGWETKQQSEKPGITSEAEAKNLLNQWDSKYNHEITESNRLLDTKEKDISSKTPEPDINTSADNAMDDWELGQVILDKKAGVLMEQTELDERVQDIIKVKKEEAERAQHYTLGPGDGIQVAVRDHPELSGHVIIALDGNAVLPLTNDVVAARGLTADELGKKITKVMQKYVKDPETNVTVVEYNSKVFYVVDESGSSSYPITRANLTLRDALFLSDWGTNRALGRVLLIKPSKIHPIVKKIDAFDIIYRGNLLNNLPIENGDVIYVPMTIVGKTNAVLIDTFGPLSNLSAGASIPNSMMTTFRQYRGQSGKAITQNPVASNASSTNNLIIQ